MADCPEAGPFDWPPKSIQDNYRRACHWRAARILRFAECQSRERDWIWFSELAERYGRNIGVSEGYEQLRLAIIAGEFERKGRCGFCSFTILSSKQK